MSRWLSSHARESRLGPSSPLAALFVLRESGKNYGAEFAGKNEPLRTRAQYFCPNRWEYYQACLKEREDGQRPSRQRFDYSQGQFSQA